MAASGPPFDVPGLAWIALAPLLWAIVGASARAAMALGAVTGAVCLAIIAHGTLLYDARLALLVPAMAALVFGTFAVISGRFLRDPRRWMRVVGPAIAWTALEVVACQGAINLPSTLGLLLADSPAGMLARIVGVHGLSFLLVLSAAMVTEGLRARGAPVTMRLAGALAPACAALAIGAWLQNQSLAHTGVVRYRAVQPAIPFGVSSASWTTPAHRALVRDIFAGEVRGATQSGVDLFLWPEGGEMLSAFESERTRRWLPELFRGTPVFLVSSTDLAPNGLRRNRVWAFDGSETPRVYQKRRLVPLAEERYEPGAAADGPLKTPVGVVGPLICFESCFPEPARRMAAAGATLLFASTSDAAFEETAVPLWHRAAAVLRAVESGRTVLFVSNRGPSAEIDPLGRLRRELPLGQRGLLEGEARLYDVRTPFVTWGRWLAALAVAGLVVLLALARPLRPVPAPRWWEWALGGALAPAATLALIAVSLGLASGGQLGLGVLRPPPSSPPGPMGEELLQLQRNTCGPAALAYLLSYLGEPVVEAQILRHVTLRPDGTTLRDLRDAARALGYPARGEQQDYAALAAAPLPSIAHLNDAHYVVVLAADSTAVDVFDPLVGPWRLDRSAFLRRWSGNVLVVDPLNVSAPSDGPHAPLMTGSANGEEMNR